MSALTAGGGTRHQDGAGRRSVGRWHSIGSALLVLAACVLAPLAIVAVWTNDEVSDTETYVATVTPLASDPAVQRAVIDLVTDAVVTALDVPRLTREVVDRLADRELPAEARDSLEALAVSLVDGVHAFVARHVGQVVRSPQFQAAWEEANGEAHGQLVQVLTGETGGALAVSGTTVSLDLAVVVNAVRDLLVDAGLSIAAELPEVHARFTIMQSTDLEKAQSAVRLLGALARVLPFLALACLAGALAVARPRRRVLLLASIGIVLSMIALYAALAVVRSRYLGEIPADQLPRDAAAAMFDTLLRFMVDSLAAVALLSAVVGAAAWVTDDLYGRSTR